MFWKITTWKIPEKHVVNVSVPMTYKRKEKYKRNSCAKKKGPQTNYEQNTEVTSSVSPEEEVCVGLLSALFIMLNALFYPLFHFKIITLLKVFYNFTKFLHIFI